MATTTEPHQPSPDFVPRTNLMNVGVPIRPRLPEFLRLPASGLRCPVSGLTRSALNELILGDAPPVRSVVLRKRGAVRGVRLIDTASLLDYLHRQPTK